MVRVQRGMNLHGRPVTSVEVWETSVEPGLLLKSTLKFLGSEQGTSAWNLEVQGDPKRSGEG